MTHRLSPGTLAGADPGTSGSVDADNEDVLLGLVFDPRIIASGDAPLGAGIYELKSGAVVAVVASSPTSDLSEVIAETIASLEAAGCELKLDPIESAHDVRQALIAKVHLAPESLRREIMRQSVSPSARIPAGYLLIQPRSRLDILYESLGLQAALRQGAPGRSISIYRKTSSPESYLAPGFQSELSGPSGWNFDREQIRRRRAVYGAIIPVTGIHPHHSEHFQIETDEDQVQRKSGVFHPERSLGRVFIRKQEYHSVVESEAIPARKTSGSCLRGRRNLETKIRVASVKHRRVVPGKSLRLHRSRFVRSGHRCGHP